MNGRRFVFIVITCTSLGYLAGDLRLLTPASTALAQDAGEGGMNEETQKAFEAWAKLGRPSEHHKILDGMTGEWNVTYTFLSPTGEEFESTGTLKREWVLDGRYLYETVDARTFTGEGRYHAVGYTGYNNIEGVYETIWMDNQSTAMLSERGTYDAETKKITLKGKRTDPGGASIPTRSQIDLSNADRHLIRGYITYPDGTEHQQMDGHAERRH